METIVPFSDRYLRQVAELHIQYLPTDFKRLPGLKLLELYYEAISRKDGSIGFLALFDGQVAGYICGIWDSLRLRHNLISHSALQLIFWGLLQFAVAPKIFLNFIRRFRSPESLPALTNRYELRPIVVNEKYRGSGVAARLLNKLLDDAATRGFPKLVLICAENNQAANKYYQKSGFKITGSFQVQGEPYFQYERSTRRLNES